MTARDDARLMSQLQRENSALRAMAQQLAGDLVYIADDREEMEDDFGGRCGCSELAHEALAAAASKFGDKLLPLPPAES